MAHLGDASVFFPSSLFPFPPPGEKFFKKTFFIWIWLGIPHLAKSYLVFFLHVRKDYSFAWKGWFWRSNVSRPFALPDNLLRHPSESIHWTRQSLPSSRPRSLVCYLSVFDIFKLHHFMVLTGEPAIDMTSDYFLLMSSRSISMSSSSCIKKHTLEI